MVNLTIQEHVPLVEMARFAKRQSLSPQLCSSVMVSQQLGDFKPHPTPARSTDPKETPPSGSVN
jgi:hypothetical protein